MISNLLARGFSGAIRALTGARGLWVGCAPSAERRVYYGNHASHGDFVLIWSALPPALRRRVRPVAAADYWQGDALRRYLIRSVFNGVLIERGASERGAIEHNLAGQEPTPGRTDPIETLCAAVDQGASLILFPEGTRNQGDGVLAFKSGLYHLARKRPQLELVPVWIDNLARVMPKGKWLPLPLLCTATFGEPVQLRDNEDKAAFLGRARDALLALSMEPAAGDGGDRLAGGAGQPLSQEGEKS